jgi:hypothetical protein
MHGYFQLSVLNCRSVVVKGPTEKVLVSFNFKVSLPSKADPIPFVGEFQADAASAQNNSKKLHKEITMDKVITLPVLSINWFGVKLKFKFKKIKNSYIQESTTVKFYFKLSSTNKSQS